MSPVRVTEGRGPSAASCLLKHKPGRIIAHHRFPGTLGQVKLHIINPKEFGPSEALPCLHDCKMPAVVPLLSQASSYHM